MKRKRYTHVGLGGTFDHFHKGHEKFILFASALAQHLVIGVTSQKIIQHKIYPNQIQHFKKRISNVVKFCRKHNISHSIVELNDIFGPTLTDDRLDALVVTEHTTQGAIKINKYREKMRLSELIVHVCGMYTDSAGQVLSSSSIRSGIANSEGQRFDHFLSSGITLKKEQKQAISQHQHLLIEDYYSLHAQPDQGLRFVVGDVTTQLFEQHNFPYSLAVIDGKIQRVESRSELFDNTNIQVHNKPGEISGELTKTLLEQIQLEPNRVIVGVHGEEDLAATALALIAPLGSEIYYGVPGKGIGLMDATLKLKSQLYELLQ